MTGLRNVSRSPQHLSRQGTRHFSVLDHGNSVDEHVLHAFRQPVRIVESCHITRRLRIEHNHVRPHTLLQHATIREPHALGGQR